jgi:hypothetical protein
MWADSLYFLYVVFGSIYKAFTSFQHILCLYNVDRTELMHGSVVLLVVGSLCHIGAHTKQKTSKVVLGALVYD